MKKLITVPLVMLLALGMQTTAFAANPELPVAVDDSFTSTERVVSGNVLKNDSWNPSHTAKITDAELWSVSDPSRFYVDIFFEPSGLVTVNFGPYNGEELGKPRVATVGYTLTDSAKNFSTGRAVFTEKPEVVEPSVVEPSVVEPEAESVAASGSSDEKEDSSTAWGTSASTTDSGSSTLISIVVAAVFVGFLAYEFTKRKK